MVRSVKARCAECGREEAVTTEVCGRCTARLAKEAAELDAWCVVSNGYCERTGFETQGEAAHVADTKYISAWVEQHHEHRD